MFNPVFFLLFFFLPYSSGAGVAKAKSSDSDQISPKPAGRETEERESRERVCVSLPPPKSRKAYQGKRRSVGAERERRRGIQRNFRGYFLFPFPLLLLLILKFWKKLEARQRGTVVKDGRAASVDALPRGRHGRTPRPGAAYAGWHGGYGRRGKKAGHRRHITANNDHHRPKLRRSTGQVRIRQKKTLVLLIEERKY